MVPQVRQTVNHLYEFRTRLQQKWETGRSRLEQIYQLRLFDDDVTRMSSWLDQQRHLFLTEYLDIGQSASHVSYSINYFCYIINLYFDKIMHDNVVII